MQCCYHKKCFYKIKKQIARYLKLNTSIFDKEYHFPVYTCVVIAEVLQCCISSSRLKPLDIEFMKRLHEKVNIIPLIAKADTLTPEECQQFKKQVSQLQSLNSIVQSPVRLKS